MIDYTPLFEGDFRSRGGSMKKTLGIFTLLILSCASAWAQATAQMHGTVQDSTGAAVAGAEVKATQTATGTIRATTSGADGSFVLTSLPIGPYRLEVAKEGFAKANQTGIELQVNADPAIDVALKVGSVTEQVNVETRSSGVGEVIQNQRILELPLNGRNVTDLIGMAGAAVQTGTTQTRWFNNLPVISIGGTVAAGGAGGSNLLGTEYTLDGALHLNILSGSTMPVAFPDAVQEFKVETTGQSAQRGTSTFTAARSPSSATTVLAAHASIFLPLPAPTNAISLAEFWAGGLRKTSCFTSVATRAPPSARPCRARRPF
jgi:hypothetical protein